MEIHSSRHAGLGVARRRDASADLLRGRPLEVRERLLTEAARLEAKAPDAAVSRYIDASVAAWVGGDADAAVADVRTAHKLARARSASVRATADLALGLALAVRNPARSGRLIRSALGKLPGPASPLDLVRAVGLALLWIDEYEGARAVLETGTRHGRATRDRWLPNLLDTLALLDFRTGRWSSAQARSTEALRLATKAGLRSQAASCHTTLARVAAARGSESECRAHLAAAAELAGRDTLANAYAATAAALLELGLGRPEAASESLERIRLPDELSLFDWRADLAEAWFRCGRSADAETQVAAMERHAEATRRPLARALAARCRGLLAPGALLDEAFGEALRLHAAVPMPFERARTELCYGERLRRARRRGDARRPLRSALETFIQLGAVGWAERARQELALTYRRGEGTKRDTLLLPLTSYELRVASLVERGARNREIARGLFLRERTVEYHLTNIYRKLGVRSRTELVRLMMARSGV